MTDDRDTFRALVVDRQDDRIDLAMRNLPLDALPDGDVLVRVAFSDLNYKDGLALTGQGNVVRSYPMVPGIDFAGTVEKSDSPAWKPGDPVVATGWGLGERHWGGYAEWARVPGEWLVALPQGLSLRHAMGIGTAGLTAMLCLLVLQEQEVRPESGEVVVTGAAGGVGSVAVALLARNGYSVVASTGRPEAQDYLTRLGAKQVVERQAFSAVSEKALETERWSGAIDTVGGNTLAGLLRGMAYGSCIAACGVAGGGQLNTTVFPFILRNVRLIGVESSRCPMSRRRTAWLRLAKELPVEDLERMMQTVSLHDIPALSRQILAGQVRGRIVVDVSDKTKG